MHEEAGDELEQFRHEIKTLEQFSDQLSDELMALRGERQAAYGISLSEVSDALVEPSGP